jgi:YegS/Rv2252/BmrU family lipid kinase
MDLLIIVNNAAAKAQAAWPMVEERLNAVELKYELYRTTSPGDATQKTRSALNEGTRVVAVVGGDGTLGEAAEGFFNFADNIDQPPTPINRDAALAVLPAGTGDDFARGLYRRRMPLADWIDTLIRHCKYSSALYSVVDVLYGRCNNYEQPFICLNASTMGIGGETAGRVAAQGSFMRRFSGELRFAVATLSALTVWRERRVRVTVDDQVIADGPMNLAAVANAFYAGGGMVLSPDARADDGRLDVVTASGLSRTAVVRELSRIHSGGHVNNPKVRISQGKVVQLHTFSTEDAMPLEADGNVRGFTPVHFEIIPRALKFVY